MNSTRYGFVLATCVVLLHSAAADPQGARTNAVGPGIILDGGTQKDAEQALAVCREWLTLWQSGKHEKASLLVVEPVRKQMLAYMQKRAIELKSIDDVRIFTRNERLLGRIHATVAPTQGIGIDMEFQNGKWWITAR